MVTLADNPQLAGVRRPCDDLPWPAGPSPLARRARRWICAASLAVTHATFAAPAAAADAAPLRQALAQLDPAGIPGGILYDRVLPFAGLEQLDGTRGAPPVTPARWRQALHELRSAANHPPEGWPTDSQARIVDRASPGRSHVTLALLDVAYSRLDPAATSDGRLIVNEQGLIPAAGVVPSQLYVQRRAFAATAMSPTIHHGRDVTFVLPRRLYVGASAQHDVSLQLDAGDGAGWRPLRVDQPLRVSYAGPGPRLARLRLARGAGVLESTFPIEVRALAAPAPDDTLAITATVAYQGAVAAGHAYVYLAPGHALPINPVVVVEGFDLDNSMGWDQLYELLNREGLLETLRAEGYDAVVLDFVESTEYIQRNAFVLVQLLQQLAVLNAGQDVAVVGASMGGLVARYALAWMESQALPHHARTFISFDSPQNGANIPLGMQYWLDFFQGDSTEAAYLLGRLDTPAARQMLLYHHTSPAGATGTSDALRAGLLADLALVGDWPALPRKVAVANGSGSRVGQGYAAGAQVISYEYGSFLVDIVGNVWAVPDATNTQIFRGLVDLIWPLPDRATTVAVTGTRPWDNAPGGYRASMAQMDTTDVPYGDITALHGAHAFIPTVSALALSTSDPFFDIAGAADLLALTPFDAVYFPAQNQEHVAVTAENRVWLLEEIGRGVTAVAPEAARLPAHPLLYSACPNPFNPRTSLQFALPIGGPVELVLCDARGRRVRTLVDSELPAGMHAARWDGRDQQGAVVASGVYRVVLTAPGGRAMASLTLVR